jgi:hypothetical protein
LETLMLSLDVLRLMTEAAGTRVIVKGSVVDAARPPRCQVAEVTSAPEVPIVWRGMRDSLLHPRLSGHLANAVVVSYDAVEALGNANGDLERL